MPSLPHIHIVAEGESLASIATQYGFFESTLWNYGDNAALREKRTRAAVLAAGDEVSIPALTPKHVSIATGATHAFKRKGIPAVFRLRLLNGTGPARDASYSLTVDDGEPTTGTLDENGALAVFIPPNAKTGELRVPSLAYAVRLAFGQLDPVSELTGVQKRLVNLGMLAGPVSGQDDDATRAALRAFQESAGLPLTGTCDDATRAALEKAHDVGL